MNYIEEIQKLKQQKNAIILAHYYQPDEIQEIADYVGDSLGLARKAADNDAEMIIFCGVKFMAETAAILSPDKKVILPEILASCPMALMAKATDVVKLKEKHPDAAVVTYVNSTADVKAVSDICCTSSNALNIVKKIPEKKIIFVPDQNLGHYIGTQVPEKEIILWDGYCPTHHKILPEMVEKTKEKYPKAKILAHPESRPQVLDLADFIGSTTQIIEHATNSNDNEFIIITEKGILYELKKRSPQKKFHIIDEVLSTCPNMKKTNLAKLYKALNEEKYHIIVTDDIANRAKKAIERMLEY